MFLLRSSIARLGLIVGTFILITVIIVSCDLFMPNAPAGNTIFDAPLDGLTQSQLRTHFFGDEAFAVRHTFGTGVGPLFIASSCDTCHPGESKGILAFAETRFGRMTDKGFSGLEELGGPQLQERSVPGYPAEEVPEIATGVTQLMPPIVVGLGLLEEVPDTILLAMADPNDSDGDGISGRVQLIGNADLIAAELALTVKQLAAQEGEKNARISLNGKYIGRFGWKASSINLFHQTVQAYSEDMGLTTPFAPTDLFNVQTGVGSDDVVDPEISGSTVRNVVFYLRTLRPPLRRYVNDPEVIAGKELFIEVGCASCHRPTLKTGPSEIPQLSNRIFHPYTDLLLHDMGPKLDDGYTEGRAKTFEWRTAPLWGLGLAAEFQGGTPCLLHDGRASSIREAISFHGGEAAQSRKNFMQLSEEETEDIIAFLKSL